MKNIVLLSDGTGNSAAKLFKTNVWRLYQALDLTDETRQIAYYDDGVGSASFKPWALVTGAVGIGLQRNVVDLYCFLCRNYGKGDNIYCFGFSRGAFTIRILIGLVNSQGLVQAQGEADLRAKANAAFKRYRNVWKHWGRKLHKARRTLGMKSEARGAGTAAGAPKIAFAGLWDTVAAYGLPFDELTKLMSFLLPLSVPDRNPCPIMERACHALAIDDERRTFHPVLWNEQGLGDDHDREAAHIDGERITQVWFSGAHSDVGGGYAEDGLAYPSLDWIMDEAHKHGLLFDSEAWKRVKAAVNVNGMLHDPRKGLSAFYRYKPRDITHLCNDTSDRDNQVVIARPKIHESALRRIVHSDESYAPIVLPAQYAVLDAGGTIHDLPTRPSAAVPPYVRETGSSAKVRHARQRELWSLIRGRSFLYWCSALVVAALVLAPFFPSQFPASTAQDWAVKNWVVKILGAVVPDFLGFWVEFWAARLPEFFVVAAALSLLHWLSARVRTRIRDRMRAIWTGLPTSRPALPDEAVRADT